MKNKFSFFKKKAVKSKEKLINGERTTSFVDKDKYLKTTITHYLAIGFIFIMLFFFRCRPRKRRRSEADSPW
ncbi:MAG: hypothetical protein LEGION0398_MBIBDBAK_01035 [Legionellaceae bacterium]